MNLSLSAVNPQSCPVYRNYDNLSLQRPASHEYVMWAMPLGPHRLKRWPAGSQTVLWEQCVRRLLFQKCSTSFVFFIVVRPQGQSHFKWVLFFQYKWKLPGASLPNSFSIHYISLRRFVLPAAWQWSLPAPLLLCIHFWSICFLRQKLQRYKQHLWPSHEEKYWSGRLVLLL